MTGRSLPAQNPARQTLSRSVSFRGCTRSGYPAAPSSCHHSQAAHQSAKSPPHTAHCCPEYNLQFACKSLRQSFDGQTLASPHHKSHRQSAPPAYHPVWQNNPLSYNPPAFYPVYFHADCHRKILRCHSTFCLYPDASIPALALEVWHSADARSPRKKSSAPCQAAPRTNQKSEHSCNLFVISAVSFLLSSYRHRCPPNLISKLYSFYFHLSTVLFPVL